MEVGINDGFFNVPLVSDDKNKNVTNSSGVNAGVANLLHDNKGNSAGESILNKNIEIINQKHDDDGLEDVQIDNSCNNNNNNNYYQYSNNNNNNNNNNNEDDSDVATGGGGYRDMISSIMRAIADAINNGCGARRR